MTKSNELIGTVYNKLTIVQDLGVFNKNRKVKCSCICGNSVDVYVFNLKKGNTQSCGCYLSESSRKRWDVVYDSRDFGKKDQTTPEYLAWRNMKARCYNENDISYPNYGEVGIEVCKQWLDSFDQFISDVGKRPSKKHSLDRFDVNKDYSPDNVSWKDSSWQSRNKSKLKNCTSKYKGVSFDQNKWRARVKNLDGKPICLGSYENEREAALKVDLFLVENFGKDCPWTNEKLGLLNE